MHSMIKKIKIVVKLENRTLVVVWFSFLLGPEAKNPKNNGNFFKFLSTIPLGLVAEAVDFQPKKLWGS